MKKGVKSMSERKWVYLFNEVDQAEANSGGSWDKVRGLLGGKETSLADMTRIGVPVHSGFTVTTEACNVYSDTGKFPEGLWEQMLEALAVVEKQAGKKFGDRNNPLLLSCRSGAKFSMPGMMDTVLNIGLNDDTAAAMAELTGNKRFVYDSYRRLIHMFGSVVMEIPDEVFEEPLEAYKVNKDYKADTEMTAEDWEEIANQYKAAVKSYIKKDFPQDAYEQVKLATEAVFRSWNGKRAIDYRRAENISDSLGTAVNIQTMVFGNMGNDSGTGVAFTRNPLDGTNHIFGEYLLNAQGEDVVAGIRNAENLDTLKDVMPDIYNQFWI